MLMRKRVNPLVYVAFDSEASVFSPFAGGDPARTRKTTAGFFREGVLHDHQALKESTFGTRSGRYRGNKLVCRGGPPSFPEKALATAPGVAPARHPFITSTRSADSKPLKPPADMMLPLSVACGSAVGRRMALRAHPSGIA